MDNLTGDSLPENCIILSPEELTKLGVKLQNSPPTTSRRSDSSSHYAKQQKDVSTTSKNTQDELNLALSSKTPKIIRTYTNSNKKCDLDKQKNNIGDNSQIMENLIESNTINEGNNTQERTNEATSNSESPSSSSGHKIFPSTDESNHELKETYQNSSEISIGISDNGVQKPKRGRPKKSVPNVISRKVDGGNVGLLSAQTDNESPKNISIGSDTSFKETSNMSIDKSRKGKRCRIKNYSDLDSDLSSNSDLNHDSDSDAPLSFNTKKRKKGITKIRRISDSDASSENGIKSSNKKFAPKQNLAKIARSGTNTTSEVPVRNDVNIPLKIANESEGNKVPKKRGRPKKNSLEAKATVVPCTSTPVNLPNNKMDDSVITTSKRGRKRKEVNYSLLEDPDIFELGVLHEANTVPKVYGRSKNFVLEQQHCVSSHDIKIEAEGIHYPPPETKKCEEGNEFSVGDIEEEICEDTNETAEHKASSSAKNVKEVESKSSDNAKNSRYKWTGNFTKAINHMFNAIHNDSVTNCGDNPVLDETKRKRRGKDNADSVLDEDGSSVCMVCDETIPNPEWPKHKKKVHYNLAWRKGDPYLDVTNESFVQKTLKELIGKRGYLKCNKCSEKIRSAKKFASHIEICNGVVSSSGCVTCAVCKTALEKGSWQYHNYRQHNNLAWREGDPPLDVEDKDLVLRILNALYKARKPLHCEKCGQQKKSVLGYLSHKSTCQKTGIELENMKVECNLCGRKILPVSMDYHLKSHKEKQAQYDAMTSDFFDVNVDTMGKRKAAKQALQVINTINGQVVEETKYYIYQCDFQESFVSDIFKKSLNQHSLIQCIFTNCEFSAEDVESMIQHLNSCEKKPDQYYVCKICLSCCKEESEIHEHVRVEHNKSLNDNQDMEFHSEGEQNNSEEDELLDSEERERKRLRLIGKQKILNQPNIRVKPIFLMHPYKQPTTTILYNQAYGWMLEFCGIHYKVNLYQHLRNYQPWQVLDCDILNNYLPRNVQSCDIAAKIITVEEKPPELNKLNFKKLDLFEVGALHEDDITIYCGGPISSLAWLPTPYNQKTYNQVLAVAVFNSMQSFYTVDKNFHEPCIVQFWDFGILDSHERNVGKPSLLFGMAVTYGPIWHLEWCPSGCLDCFQEDTTCRLGLLAVATSDSCVYIYSIDNIPNDNDRGLIYKGEPVLKLQVESEKSSYEGQSYYATKISWSKADGHRSIAVGYSTGLVALYDLQNESLLLQRGDKTGTNIIFPYKSFQAHLSSITALTISHLCGGDKFLFTASFDRSSLFWDLRTMSKIVPSKRNTVGDGVWMTQWPSYLVTEDESTFNDKARAHSYYRALRYLMSPDAPHFTFAKSGIRALSYSDWLNTILHGSNTGEVMAQFTHRMFCGIETRLFKTSYARCIFSLTKLVKQDSSPDDVAITYDEAAKKYKVAFLDYNLNKIENVPNTFRQNDLKYDNLSSCDIREYSLQSINKVAFNPNPQACSFYAIGYQAGFVRLQWIEFVSPLLQQCQGHL